MSNSAQPPSPRIYLDNAATTWPKSPSAVAAAELYLRECGAAAGRGLYRSGREADRWLTQARVNLARLLQAPGAASVAICTSGTHALNAALFGLLRAGDHVITTGIDHNSLLRPLHFLQQHMGVEVSIAASDASGYVDPQAAQELLRPTTTWLAIGHASNVSGRLQDLTGWSQLAGRAGLRLLVDASQTLGYVPIDMTACRIDALAAAGHKGLRALAGTGLLVLQPELQTQLRPLMFGGTGIASEQLEVTPSWPQAVEVGNLNMPGVVSLAVAAAEAEQHLDQHRRVWQARLEELARGLAPLPGVRLVGCPVDFDFSQHIPVLSLQLAGWDVHDLAHVLDEFGIEARSGWHCAALVHEALDTAGNGGTLRLSPGVSTTAEEIQYVISVFAQLAAAET